MNEMTAAEYRFCLSVIQRVSGTEIPKETWEEIRKLEEAEKKINIRRNNYEQKRIIPRQ